MNKLALGLSAFAISACTQSPTLSSDDSQSKAPYSVDTQGKPGAITPTLHPDEFAMIVGIDDSEYSVADEEIEKLVNYASKALFARTQVNIRLLEILHLDTSHSFNDELKKDPDLVREANGFILFDKSECSRNNGGCTYDISGYDLGVEDYCNTFQPQFDENNWHHFLMGMHMEWQHRYSGCGYDVLGDSDELIGTTSNNGECRNQDGVACVMKNGYSMCADAVDDYYAQDVMRFPASTIVHEIMHHFGEEGNRDHYSTDECQSRPALPRDFECDADEESTCYMEMCPDIFNNFRQSMNYCNR